MNITFKPIGVIHTKASEAEVKGTGDREGRSKFILSLPTD